MEYNFIVNDEIHRIAMPQMSLVDFRQAEAAVSTVQDTVPQVFNPTDGFAPQDSLPAPRPNDASARPRPRRVDPISLVGQVVEGVCTIRRFAPDYTTRVVAGLIPPFGSRSPAYRSATDQFLSTLCDPEYPVSPSTNPSPQFEGGQCPVRYYVQGFLTAFTVSQPGNVCVPFSTSTSRAAVWGPIYAVYYDPDAGTRGGTVVVCHGRAFSTRRPDREILGIGALDSQFPCNYPTLNDIVVEPFVPEQDVCGDPPPEYPSVNDSPQVNLNFNVGGFDGSDPAPVQLSMGDDYNLTISAGDLTIQTDGINISWDYPQEDAPQGLPGSPGVPTPLDVQTGDDAALAREAAEAVQQILEDNPGGDCDLTPVLDKLECIDKIVREVAPLSLTKDEDPLIVGNVAATIQNGVFYVQGARGNSGFLVITIVGQIPNAVRLYKLSGSSADVEAGLGHWSYVSPAASNNFPNAQMNRLFTRNTVVALDPARGLTGIRLSLKPGVQAQIADPGFSYVIKELSSCEED